MMSVIPTLLTSEEQELIEKEGESSNPAIKNSPDDIEKYFMMNYDIPEYKRVIQESIMNGIDIWNVEDNGIVSVHIFSHFHSFNYLLELLFLL